MSSQQGRGLAVVVSGPSGSGKTTLVKRLMMRSPVSHFSLSATSRPARGEEVDGVDYRFLSRMEFTGLRDTQGMLEWAQVHGEFYGTPGSEVLPYLKDGRLVFLDIDVQGGLQVKAALGVEAFLLFVLPPDWRSLEARLRSRQTDAEASIRKRLANARWELEQLPRYDAVVVNADLDRAVAEAWTLIEAGRRNLPEWLAAGGQAYLREHFEMELPS
jgi:guanylate kinase